MKNSFASFHSKVADVSLPKTGERTVRRRKVRETLKPAELFVVGPVHLFILRTVRFVDGGDYGQFTEKMVCIFIS